MRFYHRDLHILFVFFLFYLELRFKEIDLKIAKKQKAEHDDKVAAFLTSNNMDHL